MTRPAGRDHRPGRRRRRSAGTRLRSPRWSRRRWPACPWLEVERVGRQRRGAVRTSGATQRLVLAGHLDTVPPGANAAPRVEGDTLWGVGASDMKGGLAVMLDLATSVRGPAVDLTWCFYAREEVGRDESGLLELWQQRPDLLAGDAAVLGEPTDALVEAGCQGTLRVRSRCAGCGPTRPARSPGATPSTAWPGAAARRRLARARGGARRLHLRRAAPGGGRRGRGGRQRRARRGVGHRSTTATRPTAPRRRPRRSSTSSSTRCSSPTTGDTWELVDAGDGAPPSLDHPLLAAGGASGRRPGPRWAGPTWRRSGRTACRRPTSGPVTRCWPTTPTSG